jgi:hypothetical protein
MPEPPKSEFGNILAAAYPNATAEERILMDLIKDEGPVVMALQDAKLSLAIRLNQVLLDPRLARAVSGTLKEAVTISAVVTKRVQSALGALASLRAQRRFLELHRGDSDGD